MELSFLTRWLRWYQRFVLTLGIAFVGLYFAYHSPTSLAICLGLLGGIWPLTSYSLRAARRGQAAAALGAASLSLWLIAIGVSLRGTVSLGTVLSLTVLPVILAIPYLSRRDLLQVALVSLGIASLSATLAAVGPWVPSSVPDATMARLAIPITALTVGLALIALWDIGSQLRSSLDATEQVAKERGAEHAIKNADLEDIDKIARTANSTLEVEQVVEVAFAALQRIFKADFCGIGLLDPDGEAIHVGYATANYLLPERVQELKNLRMPLDEEGSAFTHVVRSNQPFFLKDVTPELLAVMADSDRRIYQVMKPRSLLICPLEVEGAVIGFLGLGNSQEVVELERSKIDRIQRYMTHLATAIRNASLFEDAKAARAAALEASQAKSHFLANMSHELRTPLNAVIGYSEMLQEEARDAGREDFVSDLEKIHTSGRYLLELINGVLDLAKVEAGRMDVLAGDFSVAQLVEGVATTIRPLVEQNGNELLIHGAEQGGQLHSDETKVRQILLNLLSNACKFTSAGRIEIDVERADASIEFRVRDTGIGMTAEQTERVFEAFAQADASTTRKYGGTGLGLAITKQFCELLRGSIDVHSEPGRGTEFRVRLPVAYESQPSEKESPARGATILVVDDDPAARDLIGRFLAKRDYGVLYAADGGQALEIARSRRPDVITLDVIMPGMDGWSVLTQLKADPALADIPVVLATVSEDRALGFALGAMEFLNKPIEWTRLEQVLARLPESRGGRHALVVDDERPSREILTRALSRAGWSCVEAENGRVALERLADLEPDVILLDLCMPEMDGFALLERVQAHPEWRKIPVLVITSLDLDAEDRQRLSQGVSRLLSKGDYTRNELLNEITELVERRT